MIVLKLSAILYFLIAVVLFALTYHLIFNTEFGYEFLKESYGMRHPEYDPKYVSELIEKLLTENKFQIIMNVFLWFLIWPVIFYKHYKRKRNESNM